MSDFNNIVSAALSEAIEFIGENIIVGNKTIKGVVNQIDFDQELMEGGILGNRGITAVISAIIPFPKIGEKVLYNGKAFRILEINEDVSGLTLVCETDAK